MRFGQRVGSSVLVLAVVASLAVAGAAPASASTGSRVFPMDCFGGLFVSQFHRNQVVCVGGNVRQAPGTIVPSATIHIAPAGAGIGGSVASRFIAALGTFLDEPVSLQPLAPGDYDLIVDENATGTFDPADGDFVYRDGTGRDYSFRVLPADLSGYHFPVAEVKADARVRADRARDGLRALELSSAALTAISMGKLGWNIHLYRQSPNPVRGFKIGVGAVSLTGGLVGIPIPTSYNSAVQEIGFRIMMGMLLQEFASYERLANDPADPAYEILEGPDTQRIAALAAEALADLPAVRDDLGVSAPLAPRTDDPLVEATARVVDLVAERAALVEAAMRSHERFLGARDATDAAWAVTHGEALSGYLLDLDSVFAELDAAAADLRAAVEAQPGHPTEDDVPTMTDPIDLAELAAEQERLATEGFTREQRRSLRAHGVGAEEQEALRQRVIDLPEPGTDAIVDLVDAMFEDTEDLRATFAALRADVLSTLAAMRADADAPDVPALTLMLPQQPVTSGQGLTLSAEAAGEGSVEIAWDLSGDGDAGDATGSEVTFVPETPGRHRVTAVATDETGTRALASGVVVAEFGAGGPSVSARTPTEGDVEVDPGGTISFGVDVAGASGIVWRVDGVETASGPSFAFNAGEIPGPVAVDATLSDGDPATRDVVVDWQVSVGDRLGDADALALDATGAIAAGDDLDEVTARVVDGDGEAVDLAGEEVRLRLAKADGTLPPLGAELAGTTAAVTGSDGTAVFDDLTTAVQLPPGTWHLTAEHGDDLLQPAVHPLTVEAPHFTPPSAALDLDGFPDAAAPGDALEATLDIAIDDPDALLAGDVRVDLDLRDPELGPLGDPATSVAAEVLASLEADPDGLLGQPRDPGDLDGATVAIDALVDPDADDRFAVWVVTARDETGALLGSHTSGLAVRAPDPGDPQASVALSGVENLEPGAPAAFDLELALGNPAAAEGDVLASLELIAVDGGSPGDVLDALATAPDVLGEPLDPGDLADGLTLAVTAGVAADAPPGSYAWRATLGDDRGALAVAQFGVAVAAPAPRQPQLDAELAGTAPVEQGETATADLAVTLDDPDEVVDGALTLTLDLRDPSAGDLLDPGGSVLPAVVDELSADPAVLGEALAPAQLRDGVTAAISASIADGAPPGGYWWVLEVRDGDGALAGAAAAPQAVHAAAAPTVTFVVGGLEDELRPGERGAFTVDVAAQDPAGRLDDELTLHWDVRTDAGDPDTSVRDDLFEHVDLSPEGFFDAPVWTERLLTDGRRVAFDLHLAFDAPTSDLDGFPLVLEARDGGGELVARNTATSLLVGDDRLPGTGGPVILTGIDPELAPTSCGHGCLQTWQNVLAGIFERTRTSGSGIVVIGARTGQAVQWWTNIVNGYAPQGVPSLGVPLEFVDDLEEIATLDFSEYAVIGVATSQFQLSSGGITNAQNEALNARAADIATFVNRGGGVFGHTQDRLSNPYAYISGVGEITQSTSASNILTITEAGFDAGVREDFEGCCWHTSFSSWPDFMEPLVFGGGGQVQVLGGRQVGIATGITLEPFRAVADAGDQIALVATVEEGGEPVEDAEVTFTFLDGGVHEGTTGTAVTGPDGTATFTKVGEGVGGDVVEASYVDTHGDERVSNVATLRWRSIDTDVQFSPAEATRNVGEVHEVEATVLERGEPVEGAEVEFAVTSGPHAGEVEPATVLTGDDGTARFAYGGVELGDDVVEARTTDTMGKVWLEELHVTWEQRLPQCTDLVAAQQHGAGEVCVIHDDEAVTVTYTTSGGWSLVETHLALGKDLEQYADEDWLNRTDNPRPGHFPYDGTHAAGTGEFTYTIPLEDFPGFEDYAELVVAAHAVVAHLDGGQETAWGDGTRFREQGNWAMWFGYELP